VFQSGSASDFQFTDTRLTTRMATVITRTATTPTARRITDRLSIIAACMGLIIGGMAIGCTFGGATSGIKRLTTFVNTD
jgi:predicted lipid-binding transport protein (Tim44 family)